MASCSEQFLKVHEILFSGLRGVADQKWGRTDERTDGHKDHYYTSTDFSLYKSNSIYFADSLKITVKRLFPCNTDYLPR